MKHRAYRFIAVLGVLGLALQAAPAWSARGLTMVSGNVSGIDGRQITVNGMSYDVQLKGGALQQLEQVHVGDKVDLVLTGPPGAGSTQVAAIRVHHGN